MKRYACVNLCICACVRACISNKGIVNTVCRFFKDALLFLRSVILRLSAEINRTN